MKPIKVALIAGALVTAGGIAAISAPGPRGHGADDLWGNDIGRGGGTRGWFKPRSLTADEYDTRTRERFARLDKNSDGVIDASEIKAVIAERFGKGRRGPGDAGDSSSQGRGGQFLRSLGDKDGKVTKDAFLAEAKRRFTEFDLNNDGKITDDDLPPMMRGKGLLKADSPPVRGPMDRMISQLRDADVGKNGVITLDAFLTVQTKRFDGLDRNKDGVLDKADFAQMRTEMEDYAVKRFLHMYGADTDGKITRDQFFKVAKERFARLDRKGEGMIEIGPQHGEPGGRWFGRDPSRGPREGGPGRGDMPPPASPKN